MQIIEANQTRLLLKFIGENKYNMALSLMGKDYNVVQLGAFDLPDDLVLEELDFDRVGNSRNYSRIISPGEGIQAKSKLIVVENYRTTILDIEAEQVSFSWNEESGPPFDAKVVYSIYSTRGHVYLEVCEHGKDPEHASFEILESLESLTRHDFWTWYSNVALQ